MSTLPPAALPVIPPPPLPRQVTHDHRQDMGSSLVWLLPVGGKAQLSPQPGGAVGQSWPYPGNKPSPAMVPAAERWWEGC